MPQGPVPATAGILRARAARQALRSRRLRSLRPRASTNSSPERDHSAGSLSSAGCGRNTRQLAALQPAPPPHPLPFGPSAPRRILRAGPALSPFGISRLIAAEAESLALCARLAHCSIIFRPIYRTVFIFPT